MCMRRCSKLRVHGGCTRGRLLGKMDLISELRRSGSF
ncbi:hypothetical protein TIFTF001_029319, partial [Ficus carica]